MGDDPSKRHYYYPAYQPPQQPYYPPGGAYPPPPGVYPPPPPYPGAPLTHVPGYYPSPHQPIQPTVVTHVYHPSTTANLHMGPPAYSSLAQKIGSVIRTDASQTNWKNIKVSNLRNTANKIGSIVHTDASRSKLWKSFKGYSWVAATPSSCHHLTGSAVVAGHEPDRTTPIWVGRANHEGDLIPCKIIPLHNVAYVAYGGEEVPKTDIDILCADPMRVRWVGSSHGNHAPGAVTGGHTSNGETLYIGRGHYQGSLTPGKIHQSHQCMYLSFAGREISLKTYETLVIV